jgi:hypothetical protein
MFVPRKSYAPVLALLVAAAPALAQDKGAKPDMAAAMQQMAKYVTPAAQHKELEKMSGNWTTAMKMWLDPSQPPVDSKGSAEFHMALGGRYLLQNYKGDFMGMPFEGMGTVGYDLFRQRYFCTWIDNMGTGIMSATGSANAAGDVITLTGVMDDVMTGEKDKKFREVVRITNPDSHTLEMYNTVAGKEIKVFEIVHTRVK